MIARLLAAVQQSSYTSFQLSYWWDSAMLSCRLVFAFHLGCGRLLSGFVYLIVKGLLCLTYKGSIANGFHSVKLCYSIVYSLAIPLLLLTIVVQQMILHLSNPNNIKVHSLSRSYHVNSQGLDRMALKKFDSTQLKIKKNLILGHWNI